VPIVDEEDSVDFHYSIKDYKKAKRKR